MSITTRLLLSFLLVAMCLGAFAEFSLAQGPRRYNRPLRYEPPAGPTLSPYLLYSRRPTLIYDNYHTFVRPRLDLRTALSVQNQNIQQLDYDVDQVQGEVRTLSEVRDAGVAPTGIGSAYMNYSHYYPSAR